MSRRQCKRFFGFNSRSHQLNGKVQIRIRGGAQGKRKLNGFDSKDLHQVVDVPSCHSSSHGDAFLVVLLLQEANREAFQPCQVVGGKAVTESAVVFAERHSQAPVQTVFDSPVTATCCCETTYSQAQRRDKEANVSGFFSALQTRSNGHANRPQFLPQ